MKNVKSGKEKAKPPVEEVAGPTTEPRQTIQQKRMVLSICAALVLACFAIFSQTLSYGFVGYDDNAYVGENYTVQSGLSWANIVYACTDERAITPYVHPVTGISLMLDCEIYGPKPWGIRLNGIIIHAINTVLLFLIFRKVTRRLWPSAFMAALFCIHPLHVEPVAWIAGRKDLLSMLFWMAAIGAYVWYSQRPNPVRYLAVVLMFLLGLLSKPIVVTLPFTLLLLDYWPLNRVNRTEPFGAMARKVVRLTIEKVPLFLMAALFGLLTFLLQMRYNNSQTLPGRVSLVTRCANAVVAYALYLVKMLCPTGLTWYYPFPASLPVWQVAGAALMLVAITLVCLNRSRRNPYLIVGWCWYLGTLLPVIGLVDAGRFSHADRYTYIPLIGIFAMVAWGMADLVAAWQVPRRIVAVASGVVLSLLAVGAGVQASYWRDTGTLFRHAIAVGQESFVAYCDLGLLALEQRHYDEARALLTKALDLEPGHANTLINLGLLALHQRHYKEAETFLTKALDVSPGNPSALTNMGLLAMEQRHYDEAAPWLMKAVRVEPKNPKSLNNLGLLALYQRHYEEAGSFLTKALQVNPKNPSALTNMGLLSLEQGRYDEARQWLTKALVLSPENAEILNNLGRLALIQGHYDEARQWLTKAINSDPEYASALYNQGVLAMDQEHYDEAKPWLKKVLELDPGHVDALNDLGLLALYQRHYDEAKAYLTKALDLDPGYVDALNNVGLLAMDQGRYNEAKPWLEKALALKPGHVNALNNMGWCLMNLGQYEKAQLPLRKALEIDPNFTKAMINLGNTLAKLGREDEARNYLKRAEESSQSRTVK